MNIVKPMAFSGFNMSIFQLFGKGPKMSITCGRCGIGFKSRIEMVNNPAVECPYCGAINKLPLMIDNIDE